MQFLSAEDLVERRAGLVEQVVQAVVATGALADDVVAARRDHLDLGRCFGAVPDQADAMGRAARRVGDDVRVDGVGLVLAVGLRDLLELARRDVGDIEAHVLGDRHGELTEGPALVDDDEHAAAQRRRPRERIAKLGLVLGDGPLMSGSSHSRSNTAM